MRCWQYIKANLAELMKVAKYDADSYRSLYCFRMIKVRPYNYKRFKTYICLDETFSTSLQALE